MRIFLSYGHDEHLNFARKLAQELSAHSYEVWFDKNFLKGGVLWEEYIEKINIPAKKPAQPDYYYFLEVKLPMLYVQSSFDPHYTFQTLAYGLKAVYDDGRLSNVYQLLSDIYNLATNAFSECASVAVNYLIEVADYVENDGDWGELSEKISICAKSIQNR